METRLLSTLQKSEKLERAKQYAEEGTEKHLQEHVQVEAMKKTTANMKNFWKSLEAQSSTPASIKQDDSPSRETGQRMAAGTGEKKTIIDAVETGEATTDLDAAGQTRIVEEAKGESSPVWKAGQSLKSPGAVHVSRGIIPREIIHVSNRVELSPPKEALSNSLNWNQAKQGPDDERNIVLEEPTRHFQGPAKEDIASSSTVGLDLIGSRNSSCEKVLAGKDLGASEGMDVHPERQAQAFDDSMAERKHKPNTLDVEALHKSDMIRLYIHGEEQEMRSTGDDQAEIEWAEACHASDDEFEKVDEDEVGPSLLSDSLASATGLRLSCCHRVLRDRCLQRNDMQLLPKSIHNLRLLFCLFSPPPPPDILSTVCIFYGRERSETDAECARDESFKRKPLVQEERRCPRG